jgi:uncharacterized RDD family membrane protein YckC
MGTKAKALYGQLVCKKCHNRFANRRQAAFLVDLFLWYSIISATSFALGPILGETLPEDISLLVGGFFSLVFTLKDGLAGYSPGKALMGVRVIDERTGLAAGFGASFLRNLPLLIPLVPLFVAFRLREGHRVGDGWAKTRVIWNKYRDQGPFAV